MSNYTLGIDPGKFGAVALLDPSGSMVWVRDTPKIGSQLDENGMALQVQQACQYVREVSDASMFAIIEKPFTMPGRANGLLDAGTGFGIWLGILATLCIPRERVSPASWQKFMLKGTNKTDGKQRARLIASRLFPGADLGKRKTEDRSDALLLAEYGRRLRGGADQMGEGE